MTRSFIRLSLIVALLTSITLPVSADDAPDAALSGQKDIEQDLKPGVNDLFPGDLFPATSGTTTPQTTESSGGNGGMEQKMAQQLQNFQLDTQLRQQMDRVSSWLTEFGMRNYGHFPGVETGDSGGMRRAATVQLTELVGNNPYTASGVAPAREGGLNGLGPGLGYFYNANGTPVTGTPIASDEWTSELTAQQAGRVNLQMDYSLTPQQIDSYRNDPPSSWEAPPGTITAVGNDQGFFMVWAAGADGRPIKESAGSNRPYIIAQRVMSTVDDQNAPNEK